MFPEKPKSKPKSPTKQPPDLDLENTLSLYFYSVKNLLPLFLALLPFGLVLGVIAKDMGYNSLDMAIHSALLYAGAAQVTFFQLLGQDKSSIVVVVGVIIVNLRMMLYSMSIFPHFYSVPRLRRFVMSFFLTDQAYAVCLAQFHRRSLSPQQKYLFYMFFTVSMYIVWILCTVLGNLLGNFVPHDLDILFAIPLVFLTLLIDLIKRTSHLVSALVSGGLSLGLYQLPHNLGFVIGVAIGIIVGTIVEMWLENKTESNHGKLDSGSEQLHDQI